MDSLMFLAKLSSWVASKRKGAPQESSHQMQLPQMGFGQGGEKA